MDLLARREEALQRARTVWKDLIEKYEHAGPSDVVDLRTGEVVIDRGHLRSLKNEGHTLVQNMMDNEKKPAEKQQPTKKIIPVITIDSPTKPNNVSGRPLTRSSVAGHDNLVLSPPLFKNHKQNKQSHITSSPRPVDDHEDPLNILSKNVRLNNPSKVRRYKKAISRISPRRSRIHSLLRKSKHVPN